jgi:hypothetical protein
MGEALEMFTHQLRPLAKHNRFYGEINYAHCRKEHVARLGKYEINVGNTSKANDLEWNFGLDSKPHGN